MKKMSLSLIMVLLFIPFAAVNAQDPAYIKNLKPGMIYFYDKEIERDAALPAPVQTLELGKPMFALAYLADNAGPQEASGKKFRVVLSIKQTKSYDGKYSSYQNSKQEGVYRPALSKARKDIILFLHEDFDLSKLVYKLEPGEYEFRLQAASETATDTLDVTFDFSNNVAYIQQLRKAGYLADGKVKVIKKK